MANIEVCEGNRFSEFMDTQVELAGWKAWFDVSGVPSRIALVEGKYALYRAGMENVTREEMEKRRQPIWEAAIKEGRWIVYAPPKRARRRPMEIIG